jgi:hypothetical protein
MTYAGALSSSRQRQRIVRNQNVTLFRAQSIGLGPVANTIMLILIASLIGLLYLTQVTRTNTIGYRLSDLDKRKSSLVADSQRLELETARLQSLSKIRSSEVAKTLVVATDVTIVKAE